MDENNIQDAHQQLDGHIQMANKTVQTVINMLENNLQNTTLNILMTPLLKSAMTFNCMLTTLISTWLNPSTCTAHRTAKYSSHHPRYETTFANQHTVLQQQRNIEETISSATQKFDKSIAEATNAIATKHTTASKHNLALGQ